MRKPIAAVLTATATTLVGALLLAPAPVKREVVLTPLPVVIRDGGPREPPFLCRDGARVWTVKELEACL